MTTAPDTAFQALHQLLYESPALQDSLFALDSPSEFAGAVRRLAQDLGYELCDEEILQAMNAGARAWFERKLP